MKMINLSMSIDEAKRIFDALESNVSTFEGTADQSATIDRLIEALGFRIEAGDK